MNKRLSVLALALTAALTVAACATTAAPAPQASAPAQESASAETAPAIKDGGEFVYGLATEVNNFDPFKATTADAKSIYFNIYEGLVKVTPEGTFAPAVAESYEVFGGCRDLYLYSPRRRKIP